SKTDDRLDITKVGVVARAGICEISAGKDMAVAGKESEKFYRLIRGYQVNFGTHVATGRRRNRPDPRGAVSTIPAIIRIREPEGVSVELKGERFDWLHAETELGIMHVLPGEQVHEAIFGMVRWKEILKSLDITVGRIVVAAGVVVFGKEARTPGTFEIVTSSDMRRESGKIEIARLARLRGKLSLVFPAIELSRISFQPRAEGRESGSRARS